MSKTSVVVVGAGILGTMHAVEAVRRGHEVLHLERHVVPRGASVRNFGLIWVSGRAAGDELELALIARERWQDVAAAIPAAGFRPHGSLTVAERPDELAAIEQAAALPDAEQRGFRLLSATEARAINPSLSESVAGALYCERDAIVEPRLTLGALRDFLQTTGAYHYLPGRTIVDVDAHTVIDHTGQRHSGDRVFCCLGPSQVPFLAEALADAPLRRVRLQMLETYPFMGEVTTSIADGDSLRYYPAYAATRDQMRPQLEVAQRWRAQLLLVKRLSGHLTIGDTHVVGEPFAFDLSDEPYEHLLGVASRLLGAQLRVERRWTGVYSEVTDASLLYFRQQITDGVVVVTGPGGRGMTMAPAIAEQSFL